MNPLNTTRVGRHAGPVKGTFGNWNPVFGFSLHTAFLLLLLWARCFQLILPLFHPLPPVLVSPLLTWCRLRCARLTDSRVSLTGELARGAAVVKMCAWEAAFARRVRAARAEETGAINR